MALNDTDLLLEIHGATKVLSADMQHVKGDLKEHMRRTAVAEHRIDSIERHVTQVRSVFRTVCYITGGTVTVAGLFLGFWKIFAP